MAPKRHLENPPPVSSSDEEDEEEISESQQNDAVDDIEDEQEEEEEENQETPVIMKTRNSPSHSVSESDREGTPPSPSVSGFTIKPIFTSEPAAESAAKPEKTKSGYKRAAEGDHVIGESKKKKKKKGLNAAAAAAETTPNEEEIKKGSGAIQRLWSEEDEIAILKGVSEYKVKTGSDPNADSGAFFDFIKDSLHVVDVSKNQLMDKIRRLRKKYRVNAERGGDGEDPVFAKPHEAKAFELSKKIWGKVEGNDNAVSDTVVNNVVNGSKKKAKQSKKNRGNADAATIVEAGDDRPITLGLPKQDVCVRKHKKKAEVEFIAAADAPNDGAKSNLVSKAIVEPNANGEANRKGNVEAEYKMDVDVVEEETDHDDVGDCFSRYACLQDALEQWNGLPQSFPKSLLLQKVSGIGREKAKVLNDKWEKLRMEELGLHIKKLEFITELSKAAFDA